MSIIVTCSIITTYLQYSVITMSQEKPFSEMFSFQYLKFFLSQEIPFWSTERKDDIQIDRPSEEKRRRNHVRTSKAFQTIEVLNVSQTAHGNPWLLLSSGIFSSQLQMAIKPSQFHRSYNYCDCRDYNNQSNYNIFSFEYNRYKHCEYHRHISGRSSRDSF